MSNAPSGGTRRFSVRVERRKVVSSDNPAQKNTRRRQMAVDGTNELKNSCRLTEAYNFAMLHV